MITDSKSIGMLTFVRRLLFVVLAFDALLFGYGVYAIRRAAASAASGGGLLGGFGYMVIGVAVVLAALTFLLLMLTRPSRFR